MTKTNSSKVDSLLAAIQQKAPTNQPIQNPAIVQTSEEKSTPRKRGQEPTTKTTKSRVGKPIQFWFHEEDAKLLRELAAWIAGQGLRPTDSLVIRSALRTAKTGGELLAAYRQAAQLDGRLKQHRTK
jgi:hypothetical protein